MHEYVGGGEQVGSLLPERGREEDQRPRDPEPSGESFEPAARTVAVRSHQHQCGIVQRRTRERLDQHVQALLPGIEASHEHEHSTAAQERMGRMENIGIRRGSAVHRKSVWRDHDRSRDAHPANDRDLAGTHGMDEAGLIQETPLDQPGEQRFHRPVASQSRREQRAMHGHAVRNIDTTEMEAQCDVGRDVQRMEVHDVGAPVNDPLGDLRFQVARHEPLERRPRSSGGLIERGCSGRIGDRPEHVHRIVVSGEHRHRRAEIRLRPRQAVDDVLHTICGVEAERLVRHVRDAE